MAAQATFRGTDDTIEYTPVADTPAGTVVVLQSLVGITRRFIAANETGALHIGRGVYEMTANQVGLTEFPNGVGSVVYWINASKTVTKTQIGNTKIGRLLAANDENTTVRVLVEPMV